MQAGTSGDSLEEELKQPNGRVLGTEAGEQGRDKEASPWLACQPLLGQSQEA